MTRQALATIARTSGWTFDCAKRACWAALLRLLQPSALNCLAGCAAMGLLVGSGRGPSLTRLLAPRLSSFPPRRPGDMEGAGAISDRNQPAGTSRTGATEASAQRRSLPGPVYIWRRQLGCRACRKKSKTQRSRAGPQRGHPNASCVSPPSGECSATIGGFHTGVPTGVTPAGR